MKKCYLFVLLTLLNCNSFAQKQKASTVEVINFNSKLVTYFTNGEKDDFGQDMKIAFFKDYILFEKPTHHLKGSTFHVDSISVKDGDTTYHDNSAPDMTIEKITYTYYIYKQGGKEGLFYDDENNKAKSFHVDTLFANSNLGKSNKEYLSSDLGRPKEEKKIGKRLLEKYYGFKKEDEVDTIFRYYDAALKNIPFSLSEKLDQEKQSKLIKSLEIIKYKPSLEIKKNEPLKLEMVDEIELITKRCPKRQLEKFVTLFEKYILDSNTNKLNPD